MATTKFRYIELHVRAAHKTLEHVAVFDLRELARGVRGVHVAFESFVSVAVQKRVDPSKLVIVSSFRRSTSWLLRLHVDSMLLPRNVLFQATKLNLTEFHVCFRIQKIA